MINFFNSLSVYNWANNSLRDYILAIILFLTLLVLLKIFQVVIIARLKILAQKTITDFDDIIIDIFNSLKPPFYLLVSLYFSVKFLNLPDFANKIIKVSFIFILIYEIVKAVEKIGEYFLQRYFNRKERNNSFKEKEHNKAIAKTFMIIIKVVLWSVGFTVALANVGINVNSLIASLGIGGLAVALAMQNILTDLFSSFSIYLDKPFQVGDFIILGKDMGTVEKIGLKTTRIRSINGEELVVSNRELTSTRVQNYGRLQKRRVIFSLAVVYDTLPEKLRKIPELIKHIINSEDMTIFDRCHFSGFGDSALYFEIVYYVDSSDYGKYMDVKQNVNLKIIDEFNSQNIKFAYPTQTLYINKK